MSDPAPVPPPDPLAAALAYAARGWRVLPIKAGEKRPPMTAWQDAATTDPDTITAWFTGLYRGCGVGIATGRESGIFVLDVDVADGKAGEASYEALVERYGDIPATVTAVTGSGGFHYLWKMPADFTVRNNASTRLGPGLDVRGEGGQIVAAPTIHPNGTAYRWVTGAGPDDLPVAEAPAWLLDLLREPERAPTPTPGPLTVTGPAQDEDSAAAWITAHTTWDQLLTNDGWTLVQTLGNGEQRWRRPGKADGMSATVGHGGRDVLKVFTSSVPALEPDKAYSRFGYVAATRHGGDRSACARAARRDMPAVELPVDPNLLWDPPAVELEPVDGDDDPLAFANIIDWAQFWAHDSTDQQWAIYPLIPAGRAVALSAPAKAGKSTVLLTAALAAVTGRSAYGGPTPDEPIRILYLDYEMTMDDLQERITMLGYGPDDDINGLKYALLPSLAPLDTPEGARDVLRLVDAHDPHVVIIDTFGRAVEGEENSADTVRGYYRHTGLALKHRQVAALRTDHTGKDTTKGQRGTSAKADDVDVVWQLGRTDDGVKLTRTHSRVGWVPETIDLTYGEDDNGLVTLKATNSATWPAGTKETAAEMDRLGIPVELSQRQAVTAFRDAGGKGKGSLLSKAQKWRQEQAERALEWVEKARPAEPGRAPEVRPGDTFGDAPGRDHESAGQTGDAPRDAPGHTPPPSTALRVSLLERHGTQTPILDPDEDLDLPLYDENDNPIEYPPFHTEETP